MNFIYTVPAYLRRVLITVFALSPLAMVHAQSSTGPVKPVTALVGGSVTSLDGGPTTPLQALRAATVEPAKLLGVDSDLGLMSVGNYADIVGVDSEPTHNIRALRTIGLVMKGGQVVRNDWVAQ